MDCRIFLAYLFSWISFLCLFSQIFPEHESCTNRSVTIFYRAGLNLKKNYSKAVQLLVELASLQVIMISLFVFPVPYTGAIAVGAEAPVGL